MEDRNNRWEDKVIAQTKIDPTYKECLAEVEALTPAFMRIRDALSEEEQDALDLYIAACEELQYCFVRPAYEVGLGEGGAK